MEKHVVCHKWWQKMFWGLFDACLANAYVCWRSVAPAKRTHIEFMHEVHQALVNNTFDEANCWGNKITPPPRVQQKVEKVFTTPKKKRVATATTPTAAGIVLPATATLSPNLLRNHGLTQYSSTERYAKELQHNLKTARKGNRAVQKRCRVCLKDKKPNVFSTWCCVACNYAFLCHSDKRDCFVRHHCALNNAVENEVKKVRFN
jgi:hypothetical protein